MTKEEYINYWRDTSLEDWASAEDLFKTNHYLQSLFFAHLSLEKLCKAIWVAQHESDHPPRIHNLVYLLKQTNLDLDLPQLDFFLTFNEFQIEGRYPDYNKKMHHALDHKATERLLHQAKEHRLWLLSKLI